MIKIAVCDDIPYAAEMVKKLLLSHDFGEELEIDCFESGAELYNQFIINRYNIFMTDIELTPDGYSKKIMENGMLLADEIKDMFPEVLVIFFSRFPYGEDLLRHEPFGFVNKPNFGLDSRILELVDEAIGKIRNRVEYETTLQIKVNGFIVGKRINEIKYFESNRPKIKMVATNEEYTFRGRLDKIQEQIEMSAETFIRVGKSYYINTRYIKGYTSREIMMTNDKIIPIGRKYMEDFRKKMGDLCYGKRVKTFPFL